MTHFGLNQKVITAITILLGVALLGAFLLLRSAPPTSEHTPPAGMQPDNMPPSTSSEPNLGDEASSEPLPKRLSSSAPGVIRGVVYFPTGEPAFGASISARDISHDSRNKAAQSGSFGVTAGEDGLFELAGLSLSEYVVVAAGNNAIATKRVRLTSAAPEADIVFVLESALTTSGVVRDTQGNAVEGAKVSPYSRDGEQLRGYESAGLEAATDSSGNFTFPAMARGEWELYVTAVGFAPLLSRPITAGTDNNVLTLEKGLSLGGMVIADETGQGIGGITVSAREYTLGVEPHTVMSNESGAFEFPSLAPGRYVVNAITAPYVLIDGPLDVFLDRQPVRSLRLRVAEGGTVRGRIFDAGTGEGIRDAPVFARSTSDRYPDAWTSTSGDNGTFELTGLPGGDFSVRGGPRVPGYASDSVRRASVPVVVVAGQTVDGIELALERGITVSGMVVTEDGRPVPGAEVRGNARGWQDQTVSGANGEFVLAGLPAGAELRLNAVTSSMISETYGPTAVPDQGISDVKLELKLDRSGVVSGTLVDRRGIGLSARLMAVCEGMAFPAMPAMGQSDQDGRFVLTGLVPGGHRVLATPGGGAQKEVGSLRLEAGEVLRDVRLVYDSSGLLEISGAVADSAGNPLRATVRVTGGAAGGSAQSSFAHTRADGSYTVKGLEPGEYHMSVSARGFAPQERGGVASGSPNVDFALEPLIRISGVVVDDQGDAIESYEIRPELKTAGPLPGTSTVSNEARTVSSGDGRFVLELLPGLYNLRVVADGYQPANLSTGFVEGGAELEGLVVVMSRK